MTCLLLGLLAAVAPSAEPLRMRVETLTVPPSTGPLVFVEVQNLRADTYSGTLTLTPPAGFRVAPASRAVTLNPNQSRRVPFNIEHGETREANRYSFKVSATDGGTPVIHRQETFVGSAPYYKPTIDGQVDDWTDAIPVTFDKQGKKVTVRTFWSRRTFSLLVAVEEAVLVPYDSKPSAGAVDAVQLALAPLAWEDEPPDPALANRFEFLLVAAPGKAKCFQLASPEMPGVQTRNPRPLDSLEYDDADVVVRRDGKTTYYECSLPFRPMRDAIQPSEGREFYLGLLVHDPDGTGVRDLAAAAGQWPPQFDYQKWSRWPRARWDAERPRNNRIRWGLCTSKY